MSYEEIKKLAEHWHKLHADGKYEEAIKYYYDNIFDIVTERFIEKFSHHRENELLISLLGFSPEPIILTQKALQPEDHYILTTPNNQSSDILNKYIDNYIEKKFPLDNDFNILYNTFHEIIIDHPSRNITIDITGGKKSMVSVASIFAREFGAHLVYVDFDEYLRDMRRPSPGTEKLITAYRPQFLR